MELEVQEALKTFLTQAGAKTFLTQESLGQDPSRLPHPFSQHGHFFKKSSPGELLFFFLGGGAGPTATRAGGELSA